MKKIEWPDVLCLQNGIAAIELAEQSGVDILTLTRILARRWTPNPEDRQNIAKVFGRSPEEVRWGHATPIQHIYGS